MSWPARSSTALFAIPYIFVLAFWATPRMTAGHKLFTLMTTAYILIAIQLEERDLVAVYGKAYRSFRKRVAMLISMRPRTRSVACHIGRHSLHEID